MSPAARRAELAHVAARGARGRRRPRLPARAPARASPARSRSRAPPAGLARDRDRDAAVADRELDQGAIGLPGELDVERDVLGHVRRPVVVDRREGVVEAHEADAIVARWTPRRSRTRRGPRSPRPDPDALEELRVRYLGRKSELKLALREVRDRETGMAPNAARTTMEEAPPERERSSPPRRGGSGAARSDAARQARPRAGASI